MPVKGKGEHTVVRISKGVEETIEQFIKTNEARTLGLDSKKDVVNVAVQEFLRRQYITVMVKKELVDEITSLIRKRPELDFKSHSEFLEDAARNQLSRLKIGKS